MGVAITKPPNDFEDLVAASFRTAKELRDNDSDRIWDLP